MKLERIGRVLGVMTVAAAGLVAAGCQTQRAPLAYTEPLSFGSAISPVESMRTKQENDPSQMIRFALGLSERGRHDHAAKFFLEAARKFRSEDNELAVACMAAAANEYLLANDTASFRRASADLRAYMNRFQQASVDRATATVLSLGEIAEGATQPSALTPPGLRDLYQPLNAADGK